MFPERRATRRVSAEEVAALAGLPIGELRTRFKQGKQALLDHFRESRPSAPSAARLLRGLTRHVDLCLAALWQRSAARHTVPLLLSAKPGHRASIITPLSGPIQRSFSLASMTSPRKP